MRHKAGAFRSADGKDKGIDAQPRDFLDENRCRRLVKLVIRDNRDVGERVEHVTVSSVGSDPLGAGTLGSQNKSLSELALPDDSAQEPGPIALSAHQSHRLEAASASASAAACANWRVAILSTSK